MATLSRQRMAGVITHRCSGPKPRNGFGGFEGFLGAARAAKRSYVGQTGRRMGRSIVALVVALVGSVSSCSRSAELVVGGIYSISDDDGRFGIAKLLARDEGICHVRLYKQKFPSRPEKVDPLDLSLGSIYDQDGFGMGHLPLQDDAFRAWQPVLILKTPVTFEELDGYRMWKEAGGGVF